MIPALLRQWLKANALFVFPVINHEERLKTKLKAIQEEAMEISMGKVKLSKKVAFTNKLDKLVDILNCKCTIKYH